jgi:hypothetical protein
MVRHMDGKGVGGGREQNIGMAPVTVCAVGSGGDSELS